MHADIQSGSNNSNSFHSSVSVPDQTKYIKYLQKEILEHYILDIIHWHYACSEIPLGTLVSVVVSTAVRTKKNMNFGVYQFL